MRKLIILSALVLTSLCAFAQQNQVKKRSHIPYAFAEFQDATVRQLFGRKVRQKVNVSLLDATLRFKEGDTVMVAYLDKVLGVDFDSVSYVKVENQLGRVVAKKGYNYLLCVTTIDKEQYDRETQGNENMPFFEIADSPVFMDLQYDERDRPTGYPLKDKYYFWYSGKIVPAIERDFKKVVPSAKKKAFKTLMGNRWWSWKDEASLVELLDYLP